LDSAGCERRAKLKFSSYAQENDVAEARKKLCMICAKPSTKAICDACSERLRGEALNKKKKEEKPKH
jgi:hypothetical protein